MKTLVFAVLLLAAPMAQACPPFGYDPVLISSWADSVQSSQRGPLDIANPGLGHPTHGTPTHTLGAATGDPADTFSLGDGGSISLGFSGGIWDGPGDDLVVYENGFFSVQGLFAEFAFVEVSSDGVHFARFSPVTTNAASVASFGSVDPCDYTNFGGDQPVGEGTGFDLAELANHTLVSQGRLDLHDVRYVRVIDVVGDGSTLDENGLPVYDPYPTAFATGGFDIEAVGVLHAPEPARASSLLAGSLLLGTLARKRGARPCDARTR